MHKKFEVNRTKIKGGCQWSMSILYRLETYGGPCIYTLHQIGYHLHFYFVKIPGSGNFEVIKGGTFYDDDTYYYSTYNSRPQYGEQLFENFRDFADIKNDRYRNRYPKY